jgi:ribonuclease P protein component
MTTASRLANRADIRAVFDARAAAHGTLAVVHARVRGDHGPTRWTVVAGRRTGGATLRNRAKRRLRASLRQLCLPPGTDLIVVARAATAGAPFPGLVAELDTLLAAAVAKARGRMPVSA